MRPSRPTTIFLPFINVAYAVVNLTMSNGFSVSPVCPPMVPRMPEIDLISVIIAVLSSSLIGDVVEIGLDVSLGIVSRSL